jgi:hypothetical protein
MCRLECERARKFISTVFFLGLQELGLFISEVLHINYVPDCVSISHESQPTPYEMCAVISTFQMRKLLIYILSVI